MIHRVYMKDWYFNAGIVGFMSLVTGGEPLSGNKIEGLRIGDNYIEFDTSLLENVKKNLLKESFKYFFRKEQLDFKLERALKEIASAKEDEKKLAKLKVSKIYNDIIDKFPIKGFAGHLYPNLATADDVDSLERELSTARENLKAINKDEIYKRLSKCSDKDFVENYVGNSFKGIIGYDSLKKLIDTVLNAKEEKPPKPANTCTCCNERKKSVEFNKALSNVVGFNKDNSNWAWGYKAGKYKLCPVCALVYSCAVFSFAFIIRKIESNWVNHLYFPHHNSSVKSLYQSVLRFKESLKTSESDKSFIIMIKETIRLINSKQQEDTISGVNFVEIKDNPMLGGQSTKSYNVYNFTLTKLVAEFLDKIKVPGRGYYALKGGRTDYYIGMEEEMLRHVVAGTLGYHHLVKYIKIYLSRRVGESGQGNYLVTYDMEKVINFVLRYKQYMRGENMNMELSNNITKKAYASGKLLRKQLVEKKKENQISGLVYQFLNELKIADRNRFLDKYIRAMMSHGLDSLFGKAEMDDKDLFLQFGYSFINGLMNKEMKKEENKEDKKGGENE